jgi:class 3 adenylate cyclase
LVGCPSLRGIVKPFMGDGIMALFRAPVAHEHHAVRRSVRNSA